MNVPGLPVNANGEGFWWAVALTLASSGAALLVLRWMGVFRR
jgi:Mg2+ and Co2+ transporter CorA